MADDGSMERTFRMLADALKREREASYLPGISPPSRIAFQDMDGKEVDGFGNNPVLLDAIRSEIRASWDDLRERAMGKIRSERATLEAGAAIFLIGKKTDASASPAPVMGE